MCSSTVERLVANEEVEGSAPSTCSICASRLEVDGACLPSRYIIVSSNLTWHSIVDGYRNGYNGADLKSDVTKVLWVRILHHPPYMKM